MPSSGDDTPEPPKKKTKSQQKNSDNLQMPPGTSQSSTTDQSPKSAKKDAVSKFQPYYLYEVHDKEQVAVCLECKKRNIHKIIKRKAGNTTGLRKHLQAQHTNIYRVLFESSVPEKNSLQNGQRIIDAMLLKQPQSADEWEVEIVKYIAQKRLTFNFFDDEVSQSFYHKLNQQVQMPRRNAAREMVMRQFEKKQEILKKLLHSNQSKMSFTVDAWTSLNGQSYFGITVHFIGNDWKMHSIALDFIPALGKHTGKAIAKCFYECLEKYQLQEKVQGITVDNASANTTFMQELKVLMNEAGYPFDDINQHFRCFSHILNLAVQDVLKMIKVETMVTADTNVNDKKADNPDDGTDGFLDEYSDSDDDEALESVNDTLDPHTAIANLRETCKKIRNSEKMQRVLRNFCEAAEIKYLKPIIDVSTRWNSTNHMIEQSLRMKPALNLLWFQCDEVSKWRLSEDSWLLLSYIHEFLKDFESISTLLGGERYVTLPFVVAAANMLLDQIETTTFSLDAKENRSEVDEILIRAFQAARDKILKHYNKTNWVYCAVLILDPRDKIEAFSRTNWGREMEKRSVEEFEKIYEKYYYCGNDVDATKMESKENTNENVTQANKESLKVGRINLNAIYGNTTRVPNAKDELKEYLAMRPANEKEDILDWWRPREQTCPTVAKMARDFLAIPATSVPVERLFSLAGLIVTNLRCSLNDKSIRALLCLHSWFSSDLQELLFDR